MAFKTGISLLDHFPFTLALRPEIMMSEGIVMARRPYICTNVIIRLFRA
jgi:hypothetical protein